MRSESKLLFQRLQGQIVRRCAVAYCVDSSNNLIMCRSLRARRDDSEESKEEGKKASGRDVNEASVFGSDGEVHSSRAEVRGSARER